MYLKSLKLVGFKSFADRTRLEFRPGVTVIVGPNGSGKSNVVDAVAWVMGTRSPKALRTSSMDDVIFAGTATRPGLGRAEVTLVLDNESRVLPLDLPEVSITRRLYRDGSSDYEINGVACRLLDIEELLSDSGVGRHQHVIIGQGQIDSVLNATPDDHRAVIEEAAGILKHRVRKDKAIRRLDRTDGDVLRLRDLLGELTRQMRPLRRQAEVAARRDAVAAEVRALRLSLGGRELHRIGARLEEIARDDRAVREGIDRDRATHEGLSADLARLRHEAGEVGEQLDRDASSAARIETTIERLRRIAQVSHERHRAAVARIEGAGERRRDLERERAELADELEEVVARESDTRVAAEDAERRFRALEEEERSLADQEGMSTEGALAVVRGDLRALDAAEARDEREAEAVERRLGSLSGQLHDEVEEAGRLKDEIREIDAEVGAAQSRYARAEEDRGAEQRRWQEAETSANEATVALAAARARLQAVSEAAEGLADPEARRMAEAAAGALGSVTARLDVPRELAAAVDAALGPWTDAVVFGSVAGVDGAVAALKGAGRGGVPMVSPGGAASDEARAAAAARGLDALVDRLGPAADRGLAELLLGDVVLAEGWQAARRFVERHPGLRVVTPEGDLVVAHGVRVSHPDGATPAMMEAAAAAAESAERDEARARSLLVQARRRFDAARAVEREALEHLEGLEARLAGTTEALARIERSAGGVRQEIERLSERREAVLASREDRADRRATLAARVAALEGEEAERQQAWEELAERRRSAAADRERARAGWQELSAAHRAASERRRMIERRLEAVDGLLRAEERLPDDPATLERLEAIATTARRAVEVLRERVEVLRVRQSELRSRAGETGRRLGELQTEAEGLASAIEAGRERLSGLSVEAAELRVRRESVAETLRREADASEEEALAAEAPEVDGDPGEVLASREAELRRMGPVNPLAAAEYAELSERHEFLTAQLDDLESSRDELRKVIRALDGEIEERFDLAFREVADAYERHFQVLFPGGRGRLRLSDPEDRLASGVEIEAQPLGKKVSAMTLLSGGERSLAALAFLFAVFEARPSPFYVLDEVEAALDDANLRRFLRLLERFRSDAQLIVVTHQQQTMEAADVLYGITMEPGGSSRAVAKALAEVRTLEDPAVRSG